MIKHLTHRHLFIHAAVLLGLLFSASSASAHCQIPCGIFDDSAMVDEMMLDVVTIKKSVDLVIDLSGKTDPESENQRVRWIMNKENHAKNIMTIVAEYFMAQRVKADQPDYQEKLVKLHTVMIAAMKSKQTVSLDQVKTLEKSIEALREYYPKPDHSH